MDVTLLEWIVTLGVTIAILVFDVVVMARRAGEPSMRRSSIGLSIYIGLAVCFGVWIGYLYGHRFAVEFFAGWLTEYSLSVDNLFIFVIIMASFRVPRVNQREALRRSERERTARAAPAGRMLPGSIRHCTGVFPCSGQREAGARVVPHGAAGPGAGLRPGPGSGQAATGWPPPP